MGRLEILGFGVLTERLLASHLFAAGLFAFGLLALALLGLEPVSEGGPSRQGRRVVRLSLGLALHHRLEGAFDVILVVWCRFPRGRLRLFLRHHAFLAPLDLKQENLRRLNPQPATSGA